MNNKSCILFRKTLDEENEFEISKKYHNVHEFRTDIPIGSVVYGRYSVLPFYRELEEELQRKNCKLINSYNEHLYIADIENWYSDLKDYTPKTYFIWNDLPEGSYIVKGRTNSRKFSWNKMMFAKTREDIKNVVLSLLNDSLISDQGLCVREYIPLRKFDEGINGLPITNEWRLFFLGKKLIDYGYYWSIYDGKDKPKDIDSKGLTLAKHIAEIVAENTNFFVIDLAETKKGEWILVELNDGQMSGLSDIKADSFYGSLKELM